MSAPSAIAFTGIAATIIMAAIRACGVGIGTEPAYATVTNSVTSPPPPEGIAVRHRLVEIGRAGDRSEVDQAGRPA
jgi:hypothetical protein